MSGSSLVKRGDGQVFWTTAPEDSSNGQVLADKWWCPWEIIMRVEWLYSRHTINYNSTLSRFATSSAMSTNKLADWLSDLKYILSLSFIPQALYRRGVNDVLLGFVYLSTLYGAYRIAMWYLVYQSWQRAASLKRQLDEGQIIEDNRGDLNGLVWGWVESYTNTLY
ncbi:hypothetical protein S40288_11465 [Stachybotrys chartarum IBT 40288]|nr:hypothetical protein S40288_11465 [Stachybotrys chartarum IBT 40288]